ncbi:MAG: magnesium transporter, partial [Vallitaleaceae bacterium]|nr:magnesium transporter [Vallitaleaceae bacterium]
MELEKLLLNITATQNKEKLKEFLEVTYPIDIAAAITKFGRNELSLFLNLLSAEEIATILEESEEDLQQNIIRLLDSEMIVTIFAYMSSDDIADILGILGINQRKELLIKMKESDSTEIQMLLGYGPETAGGIMTTQYIALRNNLSVKEALQKIKVIGPKTEVIEILFIINESNELIGSADLRDVLVATDETTLEEIMDENVLHVFPETDQEEVSLIVSKYDLKALPVVNR